MASLADLPNEIICLILLYLLAGELKNVRLSSKPLATLVEPIIFHEVVIVPYIRCFEAILRLGEHPRLRHHVRHLLYDCRTVSRRFVPGYLNPGPFHKDCSNHPENEVLHIALLCRVFNAFPQLTGISTTMSFREDPDELPSYFRSNPHLNEASQIASSMSLYHEKKNLRAVLLAAYALSRKIDFVSIGCPQVQDLFGVDDATSQWDLPVLFPLLSVRRLRVHLLHNNYAVRERAFRNSLTRMTQLKVLELELHDDEFPYKFGRELPRLSNVLPLTPPLPRLKRLVLKNFTIHEHDLMAFLRQHSSTLRSLAIEQPTLFLCAGRGADSTRTASWVNFLEELRKGFELDHVRFKGVWKRLLDGDHSEDWDCEGLRNNVSLGRRLEHFVLCGGSFPHPPDEHPSRPWEL